MNILIMGLGFVGLTTALGFAEKGHTVFGFDADEQKNAKLAAGEASLSEPGLSDALMRHLGGSFTVLSVPPIVARNIDAVFLCVGTPCDNEGRSDLRHIFSALDMLALLPEYSGVIVVKSTVPPDTTNAKIIPYLRNKDVTAPVANNPEFLREGYCWEDFMHPDRIVCGVECPDAADTIKAIYKEFDAPIIITSLNTAEFVKYLSNNMLANMISFSNEMSIIAKAIGDISVKQAFEILHMDKRWANAPIKNYVYPGCGFGGYCLPKDLQAMISHAKSYGIEPTLLESAQAINRSIASFFVEQVIKDNPANIGVLGLSFKPGSDDVRATPAAEIISILFDKGYQSIYAYDPEANEAFKKSYDFKINYCGSIDEVCKQAKTVVIATAWPQFRGIDNLYNDVNFIDGRYML